MCPELSSEELPEEVRGMIPPAPSSSSSLSTSSSDRLAILSRSSSRSTFFVLRSKAAVGPGGAVVVGSE